MAALTEPRPPATIFYSWQSDLPNATNRGFILNALERAAKKIRADDSLAVDPVLDRDTQNVPGAPDIAHTIFSKIQKAAAFVADVSIINPGLGRPTPNPNVLIELGYALAMHTLGHSNTILIANTASGPIESLPFDLRTKRVLTYHLPNEAVDKPEQRKKLEELLEIALRAILAQIPVPQLPTSPSLADKAFDSIQAAAPTQGAFCNKFMSGIAEQIKELTPALVREKTSEWDEDLLVAIRKSLPLVEEFARVADAAAVYDSQEAALGLFRGFVPLFIQYTLPPGIGGAFFSVQFDFPKFIGHELMVTLFAALISHRRWDTVATLCRETLTMPYTRRDVSSALVTYLFASEHLELLDHRNRERKLNRLSLHADILKERHETGRLSELSPWQQFQDADVFLYLRSVFEQPQEDLWNVWRPWTAVFLTGSPGFLLEATQREKAEQLLKPLGAKDLSDLRQRLKEATQALHRIFGSRNPFFSPFTNFNLDSIGTK